MLFEVERLSTGGLGLRLPTSEDMRENRLIGCRERHRGDDNSVGDVDGSKGMVAGDVVGSDVHVLTEETPPIQSPATAAGVEQLLPPFATTCWLCRSCCACCCCRCLTHRIGLPPMWPISESPLKAAGGCCGCSPCCCCSCSSGGAAAGGDGTVSTLKPVTQLPCCIISCLLRRRSGTCCFC